MICIIALVVFSILGIFSAKYRIIAKEAFDCVFRRITLRKCTSGLDKRLKSQITGTLMRKSPNVGRFIYKNFELISWFFTILLIASLLQSGVSVYNFAMYGNCNGPGSDEFCIFDPLASSGISQEISQCHVDGLEPDKSKLIAPQINNSASFGNNDSKIKIIEFGCYTCEYTRKAEPAYQKIREDYGDKVEFVYKNFPILSHNNSYEAAIAAECVREQDEGEFWKYHEILFVYEQEFSNDAFLKLSSGLNIDQEVFEQCVINQGSKETVDRDIQDGYASGIYGTPTLFVNNDSLVGPKSYREIKGLIKINS